MPPTGCLRELQRLCRKHGTLFIADEIFTGFGRTGYRFAVEADQVRPDLLCCGKALAGGLPIAAAVGREPLMTAWATPGETLHTATFVAHPVACAAAVANLDLIEGLGLTRRAMRCGARISQRLRSWHSFDPVTEVRGRALAWGIELDSRENAARWTHRARQRGILMLAGGPEGRVAQVIPALTIRQRQLDVALEILEETLSEVSEDP